MALAASAGQLTGTTGATAGPPSTTSAPLATTPLNDFKEHPEPSDAVTQPAVTQAFDAPATMALAESARQPADAADVTAGLPSTMIAPPATAPLSAFADPPEALGTAMQ